MDAMTAPSRSAAGAGGPPGRRAPQPRRWPAPARGWLLLAGLALFLAAGPALAQDWPRPDGHLGDHAQVVEPEHGPRIEAAARELRQRAGVTVMLATLATLDGQTMEQACARLYQAWDIGPQGALILVAVEERQVRVLLGQGLAGSLGPARADLVRDKVLVPRLREGRYGQGLYEGLLALAHPAARQAGVELEGLPRAKALTRDDNPYGSWYLWGTVLLLALVYALAKARRLVKGRRL